MTRLIAGMLILLSVSFVSAFASDAAAETFQDDMTEFMEEKVGSESEFQQDVTGETKAPVAPVVETKSVNTKQKAPAVFRKEPPRVEIAYEMPEPIGEYLFTGNARDSSGFDNHGVVTGAQLTTDWGGREASAYIFYERPHKVKIPRSDANAFGTGSFTVSFWVRSIDDDARGQRMVANESGGSAQWAFRYASGRKVHFLIRNEEGESAFIVHPIADRKWHQVTGVRNAESRTMSLYVDGRLIETRRDVTGSVDSGGPIYVGDHKNLLFVGRLDDVRLWNVALDERGLTALHTREIGSPVTAMGSLELASAAVPAPVAAYPFNGNAEDASGNGNNAMVNGAELVPDRAGNEEGAYLFYERSHRIKVPLTPLNTFSSQSFSASFWVRIVNKENITTGLLTNESGSMPKWGFYASQSGDVLFRLRNQEGESSFISYPITDGQWHHVLGVRNTRNRTMSLYVDGALVGTKPAVTGSVNSLEDIWVGDHRNLLFTGRIDEVMLWDEALNQSKVAALFAEASALQAVAVTSSPVEEMVQEPVGEYLFAGNGDDNSVKQNHAMVNAAHPAADRFNHADSAYCFSERNNRIKIPLIPDNTFGRGSFAVSFWVNIDESDAGGHKVVTNSMNTRPVWSFTYSSGNMRFRIRNKENQSRFVSGPMDVGSWHHIIGVRNAPANTISLYVDGRHTGTKPGVVGDVNSGGDIWVGEHTNRLFKGCLDEVVLWKRTLAANEIRDMHAVDLQLSHSVEKPQMVMPNQKRIQVPRQMPVE